jgi:hypothetical protein
MRALKWNLYGVAAIFLLWVGVDWVSSWQEMQSQTHDGSFTSERLFTAEAADLTRTDVVPYLDWPVTDTENLLWCGTFQLAWNATCELVGEDLHFDNDPPMVEPLNRRSFTRQGIDESSIVALAGFVRDGVFAKIDQELATKFQGQATARFKPRRDLTQRPQDIVAYAYLFKHLEFATPFEQIAEPITLRYTKVPCFGIGETPRHQHVAMLDQVLILDYQSENDFVIELKSKSAEDRLILAKIPPAAKLDEMVRAVLARTENVTPAAAEYGDVLKVPKFNFDITREYRELLGARLVVKNPQVADDLRILSAVQNIRFQLDERGVRLKSESHISFGCAGSPAPPPTRHIMVFDQPFLLMLQRKDSPVPYFAMWVANAELFGPAR